MNAGAPFPGEMAQWIGSRPDVVRGICAFNQDPAGYIDESRRAEFFPARVDAALWQCARSRRHLSRHILHRLGTGPCLEPQHPEWAVALLERERVDRLARHVAGAVVGPLVRRCISRGDVLQWREWLSADAHEFALTRALLLPIHGGPGNDARSGSALAFGHAWVVAASRRWPQAMSRRFMLKLPAGAFPQADAIDDALASRLVSSVLAIVEARWCSSFAMRA